MALRLPASRGSDGARNSDLFRHPLGQPATRGGREPPRAIVGQDPCDAAGPVRSWAIRSPIPLRVAGVLAPAAGVVLHRPRVVGWAPERFPAGEAMSTRHLPARSGEGPRTGGGGRSGRCSERRSGSGSARCSRSRWRSCPRGAPRRWDWRRRCSSRRDCSCLTSRGLGSTRPRGTLCPTWHVGAMMATSGAVRQLRMVRSGLLE